MILGSSIEGLGFIISLGMRVWDIQELGCREFLKSLLSVAQTDFFFLLDEYHIT